MKKIWKNLKRVVGLSLAVFSVQYSVFSAQFLGGEITGAFTNSVSNGTNSALTSTPLTIRVPNAPLVLMTTYRSVGNGTSNVISGWDYSMDGTNFSTTYPLLITNSCGGSNVWVTNWFVISNTVGIKAIRFDYFATSQTNAVTNRHDYWGQWQ